MPSSARAFCPAVGMNGTAGKNLRRRACGAGSKCPRPDLAANVCAMNPSAGGARMLRNTPLSRASREAPIPTVPPPKRHPYDQWSPDARALDLVGDKWTLLIVRDLAAGPRRFVELQRVLPGISTEQLRSR